jgi:phage repressor protein C with HTH and peptisase S24 domain
MDKELTIGEKIKAFRKGIPLSAKDFAAKYQLNIDNLYKWEKGTKPSDPADFLKLERILNGTAEETGEEENKESYIQQRRRQKNSSNPYLVPYVDVPAQAGYRKAYSNIDYILTLKHYPILPDVDPTGLTWRYFQIAGDSMEPVLSDKDTVLASLVHAEDWQNIANYYTHVIVTHEDLMIKDIFRKSEREWVLLSQNPAYEPKLIKVDSIRQVWVVRRHVKNRIQKNRMYDMDDILKKLK